MLVELTNANFESEVLHATGLVLVDFYAVWCGPCKMIAPHVDALAEELPDMKTCRLNVDEAGEIAMKYGIMSIPTLMFFRDGSPVETVVGYRTLEDLRKIAGGLQ